MTTYCKPFKRGVSWRSQNYGSNPNNGTNGPAGHSGADEACDIGSEVHAAGDGVVEYAGTFDDTYADNLLWLIDFGGNILVLDCGDDEPTFIYAHLSRFLVKPGDRVSKGQVIALSGNSGTRTTGPHCHVEAIPPGYILNSPTLGRVNPDLYLTEWPEDVSGIAAMGGTITPLAEDDDMASVPQEEWAEAIAILHSLDRNVITDAKLAAALANVPLDVWSYKNQELGGGDAFQILRDAVAGTDRLAETVSSAAAKAAAGGADEATIKRAAKEAITELLLAGAAQK